MNSYTTDLEQLQTLTEETLNPTDEPEQTGEDVDEISDNLQTLLCMKLAIWGLGGGEKEPPEKHGEDEIAYYVKLNYPIICPISKWNTAGPTFEELEKKWPDVFISEGRMSKTKHGIRGMPITHILVNAYYVTGETERQNSVSFFSSGNEHYERLFGFVPYDNIPPDKFVDLICSKLADLEEYNRQFNVKPR